jgi:hypothetical protein
VAIGNFLSQREKTSNIGPLAKSGRGSNRTVEHVYLERPIHARRNQGQMIPEALLVTSLIVEMGDTPT